MSTEREIIDPLTLASLFEEKFSIDWLMELSELKASQVLAKLEDETRNGLIVPKGQGKYAFRAIKEKQKLLENLAAAEREKYHRKIVVFLQNENAAATEMAYHLVNMGNDIEGCRWLLQAAQEHQKKYQYKLASKYFLKIIEDLLKNESAEADILFLKAAISISNNSTALISPERIVHILEQALTRAKSRKDKYSMALIEMHLAKNEWMRGPSRMSMVHYKRGISLAEQIDDEELLGSIALFKFWFYFWSGKYEEAVREFRKTLPDIDQYPTGQFPIVTTISYGNCLIQSGQYNQGLGLLNALYDHCLKMGDMQNAAMAKLGLGIGLATVHKTEEALPYLQDALEVAERIGNNWVKTAVINTWLTLTTRWAKPGNRKNT